MRKEKQYGIIRAKSASDTKSQALYKSLRQKKSISATKASTSFPLRPLDATTIRTQVSLTQPFVNLGPRRRQTWGARCAVFGGVALLCGVFVPTDRDDEQMRPCDVWKRVEWRHYCYCRLGCECGDEVGKKLVVLGYSRTFLGPRMLNQAKSYKAMKNCYCEAQSAVYSI